MGSSPANKRSVGFGPRLDYNVIGGHHSAIFAFRRRRPLMEGRTTSLRPFSIAFVIENQPRRQGHVCMQHDCSLQRSTKVLLGLVEMGRRPRSSTGNIGRAAGQARPRDRIIISINQIIFYNRNSYSRQMSCSSVPIGGISMMETLGDFYAVFSELGRPYHQTAEFASLGSFEMHTTRLPTRAPQQSNCWGTTGASEYSIVIVSSPVFPRRTSHLPQPKKNAIKHRDAHGSEING